MAWNASRKPKLFWLCVTVAGLLVAAFCGSYGRQMGWSGDLATTQIAVVCTGGAITVNLETAGLGGGYPPGLICCYGLDRVSWRPHIIKQNGEILLVLPLWIPFLIATTAAILIYWRSAKTGSGMCRKCGYDLTANESGVCPECGAQA